MKTLVTTTLLLLSACLPAHAGDISDSRALEVLKNGRILTEGLFKEQESKTEDWDMKMVGKGLWLVYEDDVYHCVLGFNYGELLNPLNSTNSEIRHSNFSCVDGSQYPGKKNNK